MICQGFIFVIWNLRLNFFLLWHNLLWGTRLFWVSPVDNTAATSGISVKDRGIFEPWLHHQKFFKVLYPRYLCELSLLDTLPLISILHELFDIVIVRILLHHLLTILLIPTHSHGITVCERLLNGSTQLIVIWRVHFSARWGCIKEIFLLFSHHIDLWYEDSMRMETRAP